MTAPPVPPETPVAALPPEPPKRVRRTIRDEVVRSIVRETLERAPTSTATSLQNILSHPLTLLLAGFILTGVIGGLLSAGWQERADEHRRADELREARRSERLAMLDSVGGLLNQVYYVYGRLYDARRTGSVAKVIASRRVSFDSINQVLESREILDAARICAHFGQFANERHVQIIGALHQLGVGVRNTPKGGDLRTEEAVYSVRDSIFALTRVFASLASDSSTAGPRGVPCVIPPSSWRTGGDF